MIQIVLDLRIGASLYEQFHHAEVAVLRGHVQCRNALAVCEAAEGSFEINARAVIDEPLGRLQPITYGGPDERSSTIRIGVYARPGFNESR